jgi:cobalt-zinc-cadmium efflux system membrane fusion protein
MARRSIFALSALSIACLASFSTGCRSVQAPSANAAEGVQAPAGEAWLTAEQVRDGKIEVATVDEQTIDDAVVTGGRVTFDDLRVAHIYSPVTGRVGSVDAALGQHVKKGQHLAAIQSPDVGVASSDLGKANAELIAAEHDYNRKKELYEAHATSASDFEQSEDAYRQAKAEHSRAAQKSQLLRAGGVDLVTQSYYLTSPIDGEVIARAVSPGIEVQGTYGNGTNVELFTVGELDKVWVLADVYESDLARVSVGAKVTVSVLAFPNKSFEGTVDWVAGALDPTTRTVRVRCTFANPGELLKPEMYANVRIAASESKKEVAVPRDAVVRMGEQNVVFVASGAAPGGRSRFERVPVVVDDTVPGAFVPVSHGLDKGAHVVAKGAPALATAM